MKIIVLGAGQVGITLAEHLCTDHDIYLIDQDDQQMKKVNQRLDLQAIESSAINPEMLDKIGAHNADMIIAVTNNDETNIFSCQLAAKFYNIPKKIARIRSTYLTNYIDKLKELEYIDVIIDPAQLVTKRILRKIEHPATFVVLDFVSDSLQVFSVKINYTCETMGKSIAELKAKLSEIPYKLICIIRNGELINVTENTNINAHDEIYFCSEKIMINNICNILYGKEITFKRIIIGGAGNIGTRLASQLENNYKVKLIDHSKKNVQRASEKLDHTIVLHGDISDSELLNSESIEETDLFCSVTNDDENNIMSAIIAKRFGAKQTMALVNKQTYAHYLIERSSDIDIAISPQIITCSGILKHMRKGSLEDAYILPNGVSEVIEININENSISNTESLIGLNISDIELPEACQICCIARSASRELIFDIYQEKIQLNDHLIIFVSDKKYLITIEKIFKLEEI